MAVVSVSPSTPAATSTARTLTVQLRIVNATDTAFTHVRIVAERGEPIGNQAALDHALANPAPPTGGGLPIPASHPTPVDVGPRATVDTTFTTTTSINNAGLCICASHLVYPIYFSAHVTGAGGVDQRLGVTETYVPSFFAKPAPVHVAWVWPLIDRPHRLTSETAFVDDDLTSLVSPDGRLYRALEVVEDVGPRIPITLVVDPELLAELQVMSTGTYTITKNGHSVPGTGKDAAAAWLQRLRTVLTTDPLVRLQLTPYADPDIESLTKHGLHWAATVPVPMRGDVEQALGAPITASTVSWPPSGAISQPTLRALADNGIGTVVLDSTAVSPRTDANNVPVGLARLAAGNTDVAAALTTPAMTRYVSDAVTLGVLTRPLPQLIAELAVRAAQEPDAEHVAVLTAPRYVDPDVAAATLAIDETTSGTFAKPISLRDAVAGALLPVGRSKLAKVPAAATTLPEAAVGAAELAGTNLPAIKSLLDPTRDAAARALITELPLGLQRVESAAWRTQRKTAGRYANLLATQVENVTGGVQIVRPSSGSYTLASNNSPLPITVHNTLPYTVRVKVQVSTVVNVPGFATKNVGVQTVDPKQNRTLNLPTTIQRSGRILVTAQLLTPNGLALGDAVQLTVHSTALGTVGVIITIVAGVVLVIALLVRVARRLRKRGAPAVPRRPVELEA
jgi:hypothetical protein